MPRKEKSYATLRAEETRNARAFCLCGHRHNEHENTRYGLDGNGPCAWINCPCGKYEEAPIKPRARQLRTLTLDRDEPRLFDTEGQ